MHKYLFSLAALLLGLAALPTLTAQAAHTTGTAGPSAVAGVGYAAVSGYTVSNVGYDVAAKGGTFRVTSTHFDIKNSTGARVDAAHTVVNVILHESNGSSVDATCKVGTNSATCKVAGVSVTLFDGLTVEAHDK